MKLRLPELENLKPVIDADAGHCVYSSKRYYSGFFSGPYLKRLKMVLRLLGNTKYHNLLDLGVGSGIFLPELASHCDNLYGIDLHKYVPRVKKMLLKERIDAELSCANILNLPFKDNSFDCIICLSVLEFVNDTDGAIREIKRVAKPKAVIILGAPVLNQVTDFCYDWFVRSKQHRTLHKSGHRKIISSASKYLQLKKMSVYPFILPLDLSLFFVSRLTK